MKQIKKDNRGFTLVELLIAVVVIAIVMTPLYSNFRQSTYLNSKAKAAMDATNMASNIMEGLSAYSAEEIILGFYSVDPRSISDNTLPKLGIVPNEVEITGSYGDVLAAGDNRTKSFNSSLLPTDGSTCDYSSALYAEPLNPSTTITSPSVENLKVKKSSSDKYYFYIEGAKQARGTYDVLVEMDASKDSKYSGDENRNGIIDNGEVERYNDYESAQLTSVNPLFDGVYTEGASQRANAAATFISHSRTWNQHSYAFKPSDLSSSLKRTLTINITKDAQGYVHITGREEYSIDNVNGGSRVGDFTIQEGLQYYFDMTTCTMSEVTIFDGSVYKQDPRNIYVYYEGNYESTRDHCRDNFIVVNAADVDVNFHIMRLKTSETTAALEANYQSSLAVIDDHIDGFQTRIFSNLRDDLTKSNADNKTNRENMDRCAVTINGAGKGTKDSDYNTVISDNGGVEKEVFDRLYKVTMYVYKEGAAAAGFPADQLITKFDGSSAQ